MIVKQLRDEILSGLPDDMDVVRIDSEAFAHVVRRGVVARLVELPGLNTDVAGHITQSLPSVAPGRDVLVLS